MRGALVATALLSLHGQNIGIDSHIDTMQRMLIEGADLTQRSSGGHVDFPRLRDGGVNAPFFALWVPTYYKRSEAVRRTLDLRDAFEPMLSAHPDQIALALNALDVERITRSGKIAAILAIEGGHQIDERASITSASAATSTVSRRPHTA